MAQRPRIDILETLLLTGGLVGLLARFLLSYVSFGTNDVSTWESFALRIQQGGLMALYQSERSFNHPPLAGWMVQQQFELSRYLGWAFPFVLRLPGILAECASAVLLWKIWSERGLSRGGAWAFFLFGWSFISILISGYHGNTDPLCAFFCLGAAYLAERKCLAWAGAVLAAAINVKIIPVLLIPAFMSCFRSAREFRRFMAGLSAGAVPFMVCLYEAPAAFWSNVLAYRSHLDYWGVQLFLLLLASNFRDLAGFFRVLSAAYLDLGRYLVVLLIILVSWKAWKEQRADVYRGASICAAVFAVIAPGFGGQYFAIFMPLLFAFSLRWGLKISALTGAWMLSSYLSFMVEWFPLHSIHGATSPKIAAFLGFLAWLALTIMLVQEIIGKRRQ